MGKALFSTAINLALKEIRNAFRFTVNFSGPKTALGCPLIQTILKP
jgi:hypothetical protein